MRQTFTVTVPAVDPSLLTIEQLREAAGLASGDTSRDTELEQLGLRVSADIANACKIASDGLNPPTLRSETITETFWMPVCFDEVFLSRRFISSVTTVTEHETVLLAADFIVDREAGMLNRVSSGRPWHWYYGAISVVYVAGFTTVPADLVGAALDLTRLRLSADDRDPLVKGETIEVPDVLTQRRDYWVGAVPGSSAGPVPSDILAKLSRYINVAVA
jgi:hypothetical protein